MSARPEELNQAITQAKFKLNEGDFGGAFEDLNPWVEKFPREPELLSYYGLALACGLGKTHAGAKFAMAASKMDPQESLYHLNLAKVFLEAGERRRAMTHLRKGLRCPDPDPSLATLLKKVGHRKRPVISSLSRSNPVNVMLGKVRHAMSGKKKK